MEHISRSNWRTGVRQVETRFVDEAQVRTYLVDHLLEEIKDPGSKVERECRCKCPDTSKTPIADYYVQVGGKWLPVEVKLNVGLEPRLIEQVNKYLASHEFRTTSGTTPTKNTKVCLVVDAFGSYIVSAEGFVLGNVGRPHLETGSYSHKSVASLRQALLMRNR